MRANRVMSLAIALPIGCADAPGAILPLPDTG